MASAEKDYLLRSPRLRVCFFIERLISVYIINQVNKTHRKNFASCFYFLVAKGYLLPDFINLFIYQMIEG
ncbi:MAG: hypothetical protein A3E87_00935 [Gammaproteobacteria bacterium RIFCSPHIGHO2_12_FULL_35_23]|nr:MAG: hypothetical protein A3E87_00935 [Gammaproteobacteria bacterium RIFCSPHIGHO2_12_FULL_35_23]